MSQQRLSVSQPHQHQQQHHPDDDLQASPSVPGYDAHTSHVIKKFGLEDIVPRGSDYDMARANAMPADGSTPIFAGGKPIATRRESSSPAVVEALHRGFKLAHFPARALLPEDPFSKGANTAAAAGISDRQTTATSSITHHHHHQRSPDPSQPRRGSSTSPGHQSQSHHHYQHQQPRYSPDSRGTADRIPGNIVPHVLPQGALVKQQLPPARELYEMDVPLSTPERYKRQLEDWQATVDIGSWALSDPEAMINMERHFRRCFPRTERDDTHDSFPASRYSGNYILRRYGGAFPEHCHYNFYRKYSEFGMNASSSEFHNFPAGRHPLAP